MSWLASRMVSELIEDNKLNDIQNLLEPYPLEERKLVLSEKVKDSSLLYMAVQHNRPAIVKYFLKRCEARPNDTGCEKGVKSPCLWKAASLNNMKVVQYLLEEGADIEGTNCFNTTALFIACQSNYFNMVRFLMGKRANVNSADYEGVTCLMASVSYPEICSHLLMSGADVNRVTIRGESAVMIAIDGTQIRTISLLMRAGADPTIRNIHGDNAVFTAALKSLKIRSGYMLRNESMVTTSVALALEIVSCQKTINGEQSLAIRFWQNALTLRNKPIKTPIHHSSNLSSPSELSSILNLFDDKITEALFFLETKLGFHHSYSLNLLKGLIYHVRSDDGCIAFFRFFIRLISSTRDDLFFKMYRHINDMMTLFFLKSSFGFDKWHAVLKLLVAHLTDVSNRFQMMNKTQRLAKATKISVYYQMVLNVISSIMRRHTKKVQQIHEDIKDIVRLDEYITQNKTLLHYCIEKRYSTHLLKLLLSCGAKVNAKDCEGRTAVHCALESFKFCTKEVIGWLFTHGLRLDENSEENRCLLCVLKRKGLLDIQSSVVNLQCVAAKAVAKTGITHGVPVAKTIQMLIYSHS